MDGQRKQKRKIYHAERYQANRDSVKEKALANYYANREQRLKQKKVYYQRKKMEGLLNATK